MDRKHHDFHRRLEGVAKSECVAHLNRNCLSDKFAKELRRAREAATKNTQSKCSTWNTPCTQVLKSNIAYIEPKVVPMSRQKEESPKSPKTKCKKTPGNPSIQEFVPRSEMLSRFSDGRASADEESDMDYVSRPQRKPLGSENIAPTEPTRNASSRETNSLRELEEKVDFLNAQANQLLKQLRKEQCERERMTELYDEALDEVRRLRERDRPPGQDLETRLRRLECERDEALAKVRTAQVDNEELKMKFERISEENQRDRQRWADKLNTLEHRLHTTESDRDELSRRHNHNLEVLRKMEVQEEQQKARLSSMEDQKQEHMKQIENLGSFVKDLERSTNQLHERLDEKRHEVHEMVEHMTNMEDIFVKVDQHMQQEKNRFIQMQNDAYEAQVRSKEVRSELQGAMKKKILQKL